ncbi:MAG: molecular chaperone TorD family protein [Desulfomonile sp.]|nr:molecular chaperone TorD family protein [Desulfomonile sp.]
MSNLQALLINEYPGRRSEPCAVFDLAWAVEAATVLARLFGDEERLDENTAAEAVRVLGEIQPSAFSPYWGRPDRFARDWNRRRGIFSRPGAALSLEESVYKEWACDPSHPLHRTKGLTRGEPAAHMEAVLRDFGLSPDVLEGRAADHMAVLFEFLAVLLEHGRIEDARRFCTDHMDWLPDLKSAAAALGAGQLVLAALDAGQCLVSAVVSS